MRRLAMIFVLVLPMSAMAAQRKFEVKYTIADKTYSTEVGADTSNDARRSVQSSNPKAVIKSVTEKKQDKKK